MIGFITPAATRTILTATASFFLMNYSFADTKPETRNRDVIAAEFKWDFSPIYADWAAWEKGMTEIEAKMDTFAALKGTLKDGPDSVLKAYRLYDEIGILQYLVYRYPQLQRDTDTRNQDVGGKVQRVQALFAKFGTATAWFNPELLAVPEDTMRGWLDAKAELAPYRFPILDAYRQQKHVLDEKGEAVVVCDAFQRDAALGVFGAEHVGYQVSEDHAGRRQGGHAHAGGVSVDSGDELQPGGSREGV